MVFIPWYSKLPSAPHPVPSAAVSRYKYLAGMQAMTARELLRLVPNAEMVPWLPGATWRCLKQRSMYNM